MIDFVSIGAVIADIVLICTFVFSILLGFKRGFTYLVFNFICLLITLFAVLLLCKPVTTMVYEKTGIDEFFSKHIKNAIGEFIEEQIEKNESGHINTGKTQIARPIADKINSYIDEAEEKAVKNVPAYIADKLSYYIISALVVAVLCVIVRLSTILLRAFLFFISELPFIHSIDKVGGTVYGIIRAYAIVYLILAILSLLSPIMANTGIIASINHSNICEKFYNNNILLRIFVK